LEIGKAEQQHLRYFITVAGEGCLKLDIAFLRREQKGDLEYKIRDKGAARSPPTQRSATQETQEAIEEVRAARPCRGLTGKRLRETPMTPERVKAALG
jgi:hypothetical protein